MGKIPSIDRKKERVLSDKIRFHTPKNLDQEYIATRKIYEQQKEYRKTPEGRIAIKRANERMLLKKMKNIGNVMCIRCMEKVFEILNIYDGEILCYNCRYERQQVLEEDEVCQ